MGFRGKNPAKGLRGIKIRELDYGRKRENCSAKRAD